MPIGTSQQQLQELDVLLGLDTVAYMLGKPREAVEHWQRSRHVPGENQRSLNDLETFVDALQRLAGCAHPLAWLESDSGLVLPRLSRPVDLYRYGIGNRIPHAALHLINLAAFPDTLPILVKDFNLNGVAARLR